jgi:hypothetical protein
MIGTKIFLLVDIVHKYFESVRSTFKTFLCQHHARQLGVSNVRGVMRVAFVPLSNVTSTRKQDLNGRGDCAWAADTYVQRHDVNTIECQALHINMVQCLTSSATG